ncbi:LysM peptidoglycan-binding domain-containing protein [Aquisalimonas sp.]|uniref:LysM peptidoglycan-binding domain-containing protein n=1 Tax=unclassified Aquisalimonas TaxID=2644645 RepID=UPI0025C49780|nr:LysM peptidoglycan-binding domain-containing protein [Aquisalimonas sp.]
MISIRTPLLVMTSLALSACAHMSSSEQEKQDQSGDRAHLSALTVPAGQPLPQTMRQTDQVLSPEFVFAEKPAVTELAESGTVYPDDLWARMRDGYAIDSDMDNPRVVAKIDRFSRNQAYVDRVIERAEPYLHYIVSAIEERDMPAELALLPVVESAYQPFAYSHGRAAGIWQFIPGTAQHFGLRRSWWYDGRRDVLASTEAALDYLERLGNMFDGDWELALAAYNAGEGRVQRSVRRAEANGQPSDYWNISLPQETRNYVPRLLAISALIKDPNAYDLELASIPDEPYLEIVELDGQIDLALVADLADMTVEDVYRLNPGFDRWATDPDGPHRLAVPVNKAEPLQAKLADLAPEDRMRWHRHEIQSGESLEAIARRYNTTVNVIQEANSINGHIIRAGRHLMIPTASASADEYSHSAANRLARHQNRNRQGDRVTHTVRSGDTFWDISRKYGVQVDKVASWNSMAPGDALQPGQELVLWVDDAGSVQQAGGPPSNEPVMRSLTYRVRSGDSLYTIAREFSVSVQDLRSWNNIDPGSYLQPGDRLSLQVDVRNQDSI